MNITEPLRRLARLTPDAIAIVRPDNTTISYRALDRAIDRMTVYAGRLGLRAGDICGLATTRPDEAPSLILMLALARMGVASADPAMPLDRMRLCFHESSGGSPVAPGMVAFDASWMTGPDGPEAAIHPDADALCRIFATSGTTGWAKFVPVSHALMARRMFAVWLGLSGERATRVITLGLGGSWGCVLALRTLWQGGTIVLPDPAEPIAAMRRHAVTSLVATTGSLRSLLKALAADGGALPALRTVEVGGSMVPRGLLSETAERLGADVVVHVGSTEAGGIACTPAAGLDGRHGAVGYVFPGTRVEAVEADDTPLPAGAEGILRIRADTVADGYVGETATGSDGFRDGWFYSGDIGSVWPDGMLCLSGRSAEVINSGGIKISPEIVEEGLLALPGVTDAAAFGVPDAAGIERIWAAIVAASPIGDDILDAFCDRAPPGTAPGTILQMAALPRNENGKIQRDVLTAMALRMAGLGGT